MEFFGGNNKLEQMTWYKDFFRLVENQSGSLKEIVGRISLNVLIGLNHHDLFEIIRREYEDEKMLNDVATASSIARAILYRIAPLVEDGLLDKYDPILQKISGSTRIQFVPGLREEKLRMAQIVEFFCKHPCVDS
jgi:hypothetical protein